jgi:CubicO group peptidase (beta-lactamase class C family)
MRHRFALKLLALAGLFFGAAAQADVAAVRSPEDVGFSSSRLASIDRFYEDKVATGDMAGIVLLVARHGQLVHSADIGYADIAQKRKMSRDTVFRWYSMTKPITATALMMLHEEGKLKLTDPLSKYLPEFTDLRVLKTPGGAANDTVAAEGAITIQDVLRHTAGFGMAGGGDTCNKLLTDAGVYRPEVDLKDMMKRAAAQPLCLQPGTAWMYSYAPDVQARLVEVLSGQPFHAFLETRLFKPLGMAHTSFTLDRKAIGKVARIYAKDGTKLVPWSAAKLPPGAPMREFPMKTAEDPSISYERGAFGLYGTAEDYLRFALMLANHGRAGDRQLLSPATVRFMAADHLGSIPISSKGLTFGLGFGVLKDPAQAGYLGSAGTFFWGGAANTVFWVDPKEDLVVVAMTQHLDWPEDLSAQLHNLVYAALVQ